MPLISVKREVIQDDFSLDQVFNIHLLLKGLKDDSLDLTRIELVKHVAGIASVWKRAIVFRQVAINVENLSHQIDDRIVEV